MSLLIKALDHLEKNKQADKDKKQTGEYVADAALSLELVPVEPKKPQMEVPQSAEENLTAPGVVESPKAENVAVDRDLSLEEEAGLTGVSLTANKYAKPKSDAAKASNKATAQAGALKNTPQDTSQSAYTKSKATTMATQATAFQAVNDEQNQKAAAKVFVANKEVNAPSSKYALIALGVVGALLVWLGLQGYSYFKTLTAPDVVVVKPSMPIQASVAEITPTEIPPSAASTTIEETAPIQEMQTQEEQSVNVTNATFRNKSVEEPDVVDDAIQAEPKKSSTKMLSNKDNKTYAEGEEAYADEPSSNKKQKSLTLISKVQSQGVDPTLLAAYQAFTRGEDSNAQQQYRQVLQRDVRNVDALLGMAAIAQRQGRDADAQGWYQKVLEIEPRNTIALSAIIGSSTASPQANADVVGAESRIKSMLAQQPDGANLHAALGNLYAEQNQWPSAQEAYFNASRLAPNNADYAFNLAISLDQMGKPSLALKQYQRALDLLNKSGGASPDRAQLEARIRELQ